MTHITSRRNATSVSGLLAARPAAPTMTGRIYLATDVAGGTAYLSDGSSWTALGGSVNPSGKVLCESVATGYSSLTKSGAFVDDPNMPTMQIPAGSAFYIELNATGGVSQGTVAAGTQIVGQIDVVDAATSTTRFLFSLSQSFDFATASGSGATQYRRLSLLSKTQAALATATTVKLRSLWPNTAGLGNVQLIDEFALHLPVMRAVAA